MVRSHDASVQRNRPTLWEQAGSCSVMKITRKMESAFQNFSVSVGWTCNFKGGRWALTCKSWSEGEAEQVFSGPRRHVTAPLHEAGSFLLVNSSCARVTRGHRPHLSLWVTSVQKKQCSEKKMSITKDVTLRFQTREHVSSWSALWQHPTCRSDHQWTLLKPRPRC